MRDGFANYDAWKLRSPDDEADERERRRQRIEDEIDRADYERDCEKEEPREREPIYDWGDE